MQYLRVAAAIAALLAFSTASAKQRPEKSEPDAVRFGELWVAADTVNPYCSPLFAPITIRFSNPTQKWISISKLGLSFGDSGLDEQINIVTGAGLVSWHAAMSNRIVEGNIRAHMFLTTLGVIGLGATASQNRSVQTIGATAALGAGGVLTAKNFGAAALNLKSEGLVPDNHLLAGDFLVPPGLFTDRWILFNSLDDGSLPYLSKFSLRFSTNEEAVSEQFVGFRPEEVRNGCEWLSKSPNRPKRR